MIKETLIALAATLTLLTGCYTAQAQVNNPECPSTNINQVYDLVEKNGGKQFYVFEYADLEKFFRTNGSNKTVDADYVVAFTRGKETPIPVIYFKNGCYVGQEAVPLEAVKRAILFVEGV